MFGQNSSKFLIKTPYGWETFKGIQKLQRNEYVKVIIDGKEIKCSPEHLLKVNNQFIAAKNLKHEKINEEVELYDVIGIPSQEYITNNLTSHNCEFLGSVHTLINGAKLRNMIGTWKKPVALEEGGSLKIYEHPLKGHTYVITVDVSEGVGLDHQAFSVIDVSQIPYRQVAAFKNNRLDVLNYPAVLAAYGRRYNDAYILIEINSVGQQVAYSLHYDLSYEHLYKVMKKGHQGQFVSAGYSKKTQFGLKTSVQTKNIGCMNLKTMIEKDKLLIFDEDTVRELTSFISHLRTYKAEEGKHDDLVMTLVLFGWLSAQKWFVDSTPDNLRQLLQAEQLEIRDQSIVPVDLFGIGEDEKNWLKDKEVVWYEERLLQSPFDDLNWKSKL